MKFTIVSHAGLLVEAAGHRLICDPWLLGSCYWRSWWNYPPAAARPEDLAALDYVYLTHMHWDHFHGPSLRKLPETASLLLPEAPFQRMRKDGEIFFDRIQELPHGVTRDLGDGLRVTSYQYGLAMDSALVISDGRTTLLNLNDCKLQGRPLKQLIDRHPSIDFVFRSHSSASPYPHCVTADDPNDLGYRTNEYYLQEFVDTARLTGARYAIPFASAHCFLHRETFEFNDTAVSPLDLQTHFEEHGPEGARCVAMVPGDSWSDADGFSLQEHDWFSNRPARLAEYAAAEAPALEKTYAMEDDVELGFEPFRRFFQGMIDSIPRATRLVFKPRVEFGLYGQPDVHWIIDFERRQVYQAEASPEDRAFTLSTHPAVLKDCIYKRMFATFAASKRLKIHICRGRIRDYLVFCQLLDLYECEYFPMRKAFTPRFVRAWRRRWREALDYLGMAVNIALRRGEDPVSKLVPKITSSSETPS